MHAFLFNICNKKLTNIKYHFEIFKTLKINSLRRIDSFIESPLVYNYIKSYTFAMSNYVLCARRYGKAFD